MGRRQNHPVKLSEAERQELETLVKTGKRAARVMRRAQTLLWSDAGKSDSEIAQLQGITPLTVATTRQRWVEAHSLEDKPRSGRRPILDGKQEAFLVALTCSAAPEGRETWTMQMLADKLVELQVIAAPISEDTVGRTLKKMTSNP